MKKFFQGLALTTALLANSVFAQDSLYNVGDTMPDYNYDLNSNELDLNYNSLQYFSENGKKYWATFSSFGLQDSEAIWDIYHAYFPTRAVDDLSKPYILIDWGIIGDDREDFYVDYDLDGKIDYVSTASKEGFGGEHWHDTKKEDLLRFHPDYKTKTGTQSKKSLVEEAL